MASLTGFAPVISCMRGRRVGWLHHRDEIGEGRRNRTFGLVHVTHLLCYLSYALEMVGAKSAALFASRMSNERSADELRPRKWSG